MPDISYIILCVLVLLLFTLGLLLTALFIHDGVTPDVFFKTFSRDFRAVLRYAKVQIDVRKFHFTNATVPALFQQVVKKHPNKISFIFEDERWTYQKLEDFSNQVANLFLAAGYKKGDEVALLMENRPEYVGIWLGLSKIGVVSALINTNQRLNALAHSINVVQTKAVIFNANLLSAVRDAYPLLDERQSMEFYCLDPLEENSHPFRLKFLDPLLQESSKSPVDATKYKIGFHDKLFYIYTSGTTGLPKAAIIRHKRFAFFGAGSKHMLAMKDDDIYYNPLPMYHSAGGVFFVSVIVLYGGTMAIRKKFSASNFWSDAAKYKATATQYIGEICRYLMNQPKSPNDTAHSLRLMTGNGLKPEIWRQFQERFRIKRIIEFYGATEGNANVVNLFGKIGAVGFISRVFSRVHPVSLIKIDPHTGEPVRGRNGLCIRCKPGEPGEIVGKIIRSNPVNTFDGYVNEKATRKKIVTDCFKKGDRAFLSGDVLVMDKYGYLYFQDRTGDTFRWRGENVSTCEVETIIHKILGDIPCVVYGVEVPGSEGRAGMLALQSDKTFDLDMLYKKLSRALPSYAVPRFIRITEKLETTGTYKLKKIELQKVGFDINKVEDPFFVMDMSKQTYSRLDKGLYDQVINGNVRL